MIAYLNGIVRESDDKTAVIETAGVGYRVRLSRFSLAALLPGSPAELRVHTEFPNGEIVLYGFLDKVEELLFSQLIGVPGVGGASALGILSAAPPQEIAALIVRRDLKGLTALPRVGKKLAERLIVELADKLEKGGAGAGATPRPAAGGGSSLEADLASALINFGYQPREARQAIDRALSSGVDPKEKGAFERLFKITLKELSGRV
jgi:Holliday junction DNA helicase RuvA